MKNGKIEKILCLAIGFIFLITAADIFAQGSSPGRIKTPTKTTKKKTTAPKKTPAKPVSKRPANSKSQPKNTAKTKTRSKKTAKVTTASLNITVSEPESRIFLSNENGSVFEDTESVETDENGEIEIEDLPTGNYTLIVRKDGFYDEERNIYVSGGKSNAVSFKLKPSTSVLSVNTDIEGAIIEIENVGDYQNSVQNLSVNPGNYRVSVYKNGYISQTKNVSIKAAGQRENLSFILNPVPVQELLTSAENAFNQGDYQNAARYAKKILVVQPNNAKANLLAGFACFRSCKNPQDGIFFLSRAVSYGETVALPVRVFDKEKGKLQLIAGNLIFGKNSLQFSTPDKPSLNFSTSQNQIIELVEKTDEFGITYINLKAKGTFNGKNGKETVRIYSQTANVSASRKELMCPSCTANSCLCKFEEQAIFELTNRWRTSDFVTLRSGLSSVVFPSEDFVLTQTDNFSLKLPENWQILRNQSNQIFAAPAGGFQTQQDRTQYSHGIDAIVWTNSNGKNLAQATEEIVQTVVSGNQYLQRGASPTSTKNSTGKVLINTLTGESPDTRRQEIISLYTMQMPDGNIFYMVAVIPPDESADYETAFRRILDSVKFR